MKRCKLLSIFLVMLLVTTMVTTNVQAAVKLNKSKATMYVGQSLTLKLTGTNKKIQWSSSKKSVATVSNGKVSAKAEGTATITATVNKKRYTCKITVQEKFNKDKALKNIKVKHYDTGKGIISIITNNNKYPIDLEETIVYYDDDGTMIGTSTESAYTIGAGMSWAFNIYGPIDNDYNSVKYDSYKSNLKVENPVFTDHSNTIKVNSDIGSDSIVIEAKNKGKYELDSIYIVAVFYQNGNVIACDNTLAECNSPNSTDYVSISFPYDLDTYDTIIPDDYKIFVQAFTY